MDCYLLQWGRARASAEILLRAIYLKLSRLCFNGAALVRARKLADQDGQWLARSASMGPRSCERGNVKMVTLIERAYCSLQWGRARASAEIVPVRAHRRRERCFNGAALVRARKWPGCKQLGLRRRNNRFRAAAIFNLLTNWACRFLFILLCVLRPCLQRCERLAVVRCHVAARTLAHG